MKTTLSKYSLILAATAILGLDSCKRDKDPEPGPAVPVYGSVNGKINYVFGTDMVPWQLNKLYIHPKTGDSLTFTNFRFFISNFKLKKADGTWWTQPESYYLIDAKTAAESSFSIPNVPEGEYTAVQYTMGIDSLHNVSGAQTGALTLSSGMFWDWNSGYIMLKAEGDSPNSPTGKFALHLGGFSGTNNIVTIKTAEFGKTVKVTNGTTPTMTLTVNPARLWHTSPSVATLSVIHMPGAEAVTMAKDFYDNVTLSSVQ